MKRSFVMALGAVVFAGSASAQQMPQTPPMVVVAQPQQMQVDLGGGFIEFLFGGAQARQQYAAPPQYQQAPQYVAPPPAAYPGSTQEAQPRYASADPAVDPTAEQRQPDRRMDPRFERQEVEYHGKEEPGTIVIDTPNHFLYLVEEGGKAMRYGVGVGRPGFTWSGVHTISAKKEWPDWVPPKEMLERQPYLPHFVSGGPNNPLGARALYLGSTLYRIHGSNEPWTIGHNVSSGCIRMRNADVIDLYKRVKVGTKVVVM